MSLSWCHQHGIDSDDFDEIPPLPYGEEYRHMLKVKERREEFQEEMVKNAEQLAQSNFPSSWKELGTKRNDIRREGYNAGAMNSMIERWDQLVKNTAK